MTERKTAAEVLGAGGIALVPGGTITGDGATLTRRDDEPRLRELREAARSIHPHESVCSASEVLALLDTIERLTRERNTAANECSEARSMAVRACRERDEARAEVERWEARNTRQAEMLLELKAIARDLAETIATELRGSGTHYTGCPFLKGDDNGCTCPLGVALARYRKAAGDE